jgi:hypothetical protein
VKQTIAEINVPSGNLNVMLFDKALNDFVSLNHGADVICSVQYDVEEI